MHIAFVGEEGKGKKKKPCVKDGRELLFQSTLALWQQRGKKRKKGPPPRGAWALDRYLCMSLRHLLGALLSGKVHLVVHLVVHLTTKD